MTEKLLLEAKKPTAEDLESSLEDLLLRIEKIEKFLHKEKREEWDSFEV